MGLMSAEDLAPLDKITATLADVTITQNVATQMCSTSIKAQRGVVVQSHPSNTVAIRVGGSDVDNTHGVILPVGACCFVEVADASAVYTFSTSASQVACGMVL